MPIVLNRIEEQTRRAIALYWKTLDAQAKKQTTGDADRGGRAAVTGGKQMNGFCEMVRQLLERNGLQAASIHLDRSLELPGYFRPEKKWDMLVVHESKLLAAIEFKSQRGPSFGNNFNNRAEEAIGNAQDLWTAYREGAFGRNAPRPWLGWLMLLEEHQKSTSPVEVCEPHFAVFPEFKNASYAKRYELLLRRLLLERLYDSAAFLMATAAQARKGIYSEPAEDLTMRKFLSGLAGHVSTYLAGE